MAKLVKELLRIEQDEKAPVEHKILAQAIVDISKAFLALQKSGLNRKAIILLTSHKSGIPQYQVERVLDALDALSRDYTK